MDDNIRKNITKVYCEKCDLIFESREKFENHFDSHSASIPCDVCPIDTVIASFLNLFRRKSTRNLE